MKLTEYLERSVRGNLPTLLMLCAALVAAIASPAALGGTITPRQSASPSASSPSASHAPEDQESTVLEAGQVIERELVGNQTHHYKIAVAAGQSASLLVDRRGVDVAVDVLSSDGKAMIDIVTDRRTEGNVVVELVAGPATTFEFLVRGTYLLAPAGRYQIQVKELRPATEKDRTLFEAHKLGTQSDILNEAGKYDDAIKTGTQAIDLAESVLGPDDPIVAAMLYKQAMELRIKGDIAKAELTFQRVLDAYRKAYGEEDPRTALAIAAQGLMCRSRSDEAGAIPFFQKAMEISARVLGPDHPQTTIFLMDLAATHASRGNYEDSVAETKRALTISEKTLGPEDLQTVRLTYNLGDVYLSMNQLDLSQELTEKALALLEKKYGPDHPNLAYPLQNLGIIARRKMQYDLALDYLWRSEKLREKAIGPRNKLTATLLVNIGNVYVSKGDQPQALELFLRALDILETAASPYDDATLKTLNNIVRSYAAMQDMPHAVKFQARVNQMLEKSIALNLAVGSERERIAFVNNISYMTERTISMNVLEAPDDKRAAEGAITAVLQRKGRVLDAVSGSMAALRQHLKPEDQKLLDDLSATTSELSGLSLGGPKKLLPAEYKSKLNSLEQRRDTLEDEISRRSQGYYEPDRAVTLAAVQSAIPSDAALLEFAVYRPYDPKSTAESEDYGPPHYVAYVITNRGDVRWKDLGLATEMDAAVDAFRQALRDPDRADAYQLSRALAAKVLLPLRPLLGGAKHLLISPDGELNLVPFEALTDEQNKFVVESFSISYLTTGRDLLRMQVARKSQSDPLVVANPIFGEPAATLIAKGDAPKLKSSAAASQRRSVTTGADLSSVYFAPLPGTAQEARAIQSLFPAAKILTGAQATKSALKQANAPSILHIATHGFFLQDPPETVPQNGTTRGPSAAARPEPGAKTQNPLLRSGLALSGANLTRGGSEDGILTGLEASGLNLWGTKLVTLSACETGVGKVKNGEGVYGLRRAFFLAGTETLVMSLWEVSDRVTDEMMSSYYSGLRQGLGRGEALRQAQLAMLKRKDHQHPFYWASFIQAGEWANLDGKR
jgi:CHAT domain-containing protein